MYSDRRRQCLKLTALALLVSWSLCGASDLDSNRQELHQLQERIRQAAARLQGQGETERSLASELQGVEEAQQQLGRRIDRLSGRLAALDLELLRTQRDSEQLATEVGRLDGLVRQRLGALYKQGNVGPLRFLLGGESPLRLAQDATYMERIVRRDRELMHQYRTQLSLQQTALERLNTLRRDERQLLERREQERAVLVEAAEVKSGLLQRVRRDRSALAVQLSELQQRAGELAALIKKLESARSAGYSPGNREFSAQKGRLPWPAEGRIRIGFGTSRHPELGTLFQSQGLELQVVPEQPVAAVWAGKVVFAERFKGYGQLLILEHGGGYYSLYAQLARLQHRVDDVVVQGEPLALPGGEHNDRLYFEIRKGGVPLDPREWLVQR